MRVHYRSNITASYFSGGLGGFVGHKTATWWNLTLLPSGSGASRRRLAASPPPWRGS